MRKITFLMFVLTLVSLQTATSQNGNTITNAIAIDGTGVGLNLLDFNSASPSGLIPQCTTSDDVFYKHTISAGDNKFTVGLSSAAITLLTQVNYQLFKAPNGDINNLEEITCDNYNVILILGGNFEQVLQNVSAGDVYYLRVFKPQGLGGLLQSLLNGTLITMVSEFDSSLSIDTVNPATLKMVADSNEIRFYNNVDFTKVIVYSLDGKQVLSLEGDEFLEAVDISHLGTGLYVALLVNDNGRAETHKFIKR